MLPRASNANIAGKFARAGTASIQPPGQEVKVPQNEYELPPHGIRDSHLDPAPLVLDETIDIAQDAEPSAAEQHEPR